MAAAYCGRVVSLGAHIVDILGRSWTGSARVRTGRPPG
jgi:hypothetical protein